jgi:hypothetical protein
MMGLTWLKMDLGIEMVADTSGTVTNPTDLQQWQANQLPHLLLGMEVTDKGIAMLEMYDAAVRDARLEWRFCLRWIIWGIWG